MSYGLICTLLASEDLSLCVDGQKMQFQEEMSILSRESGTGCSLREQSSPLSREVPCRESSRTASQGLFSSLSKFRSPTLPTRTPGSKGFPPTIRPVTDIKKSVPCYLSQLSAIDDLFWVLQFEERRTVAVGIKASKASDESWIKTRAMDVRFAAMKKVSFVVSKLRDIADSSK